MKPTSVPTATPSAARTASRAARGLTRGVPLMAAAALAMSGALRWGEARGGTDPAGLAAALGHGVADEPTLLFVFQAADCPSYGPLMEAWTSLKRRGVVRAVAVGLDFPGDTAVARALAQSAGLELPFRPDLAGPAERLILNLGFRRTPVTLLLDRGGRVRLALPPPKKAGSYEALSGMVAEHAASLRREAAGFGPVPFEAAEPRGRAE